MERALSNRVALEYDGGGNAPGFGPPPPATRRRLNTNGYAGGWAGGCMLQASSRPTNPGEAIACEFLLRPHAERPGNVGRLPVM